MGIRFTTNTWRAPLQLIDCWLPLHEPKAAATTHPTPRLLQRFAKAGWLRRPSPTNPPEPGSSQRKHLAPYQARQANIPCGNASTRSPNDQRIDGRLVLSGRIDQVCAELERLAAIEQRTY